MKCSLVFHKKNFALLHNLHFGIVSKQLFWSLVIKSPQFRFALICHQRWRGTFFSEVRHKVLCLMFFAKIMFFFKHISFINDQMLYKIFHSMCLLEELFCSKERKRTVTSYSMQGCVTLHTGFSQSHQSLTDTYRLLQ